MFVIVFAGKGKNTAKQHSSPSFKPQANPEQKNTNSKLTNRIFYNIPFRFAQSNKQIIFMIDF
jgi:hypothetical protein